MFRKVKVAGYLFLYLLVLYTLLRIIFYFLHFSAQRFDGHLPAVFYWGVRLDLTALFYVNVPFFLYYFFLADRLGEKLRMDVARALVIICNVPFLAINIIDLRYFQFNNRRSTIDLVFVASDSIRAFRAFLKDYWYLFLLFGLVVYLLIVLAKAILKKGLVTTAVPWYKQSIAAVLALVFFACMARGFSTRPIMPSTPLLYFSAAWQPLASNSTITFLYSVFNRQTQLEIKDYYPSNTLDTLFTIERQYEKKEAFKHRNVVVIMLESFCYEYLQNGNEFRAQTPFLDSIIAQSTWCSKAYANGYTSNQGIVSILGSMPPLLDEPYYTSVYSNNNIRGLGTILKENGYSTHFFYGAEPDHFGFGKFCKIVGIDQQHSRKDFDNERYFDGNWGIYDHRFLPFAGRTLQQEKAPFLAVLFNISSHPPFTLPADMKDRFKGAGQKPFLQSAAYVDYSLQLFFEQIKNADWYKNTLFVFCADHSLLNAIQYPYLIQKANRIPMFFFEPANPVHTTITKTVQQLDIVPTILDRLSYSGKFMSFGHSVYDSISQPAVCKYAGLQLIDSSFLFRYNPDLDQPVCLYNTSNDSALTNNLLHDPAVAVIENRLLQFSKALTQRYNNAFIRNQLCIK